MFAFKRTKSMCFLGWKRLCNGANENAPFNPYTVQDCGWAIMGVKLDSPPPPLSVKGERTRPSFSFGPKHPHCTDMSDEPLWVQTSIDIAALSRLNQINCHIIFCQGGFMPYQWEKRDEKRESTTKCACSAMNWYWFYIICSKGTYFKSQETMLCWVWGYVQCVVPHQSKYRPKWC